MPWAQMPAPVPPGQRSCLPASWSASGVGSGPTRGGEWAPEQQVRDGAVAGLSAAEGVRHCSPLFSLSWLKKSQRNHIAGP